MREQISPEPIDWDRVNLTIGWIKSTIDVDDINAHDVIKAYWRPLTNDERIAVFEGLKDKAPDSKRAYKNILKEYLAYVPEEL